MKNKISIAMACLALFFSSDLYALDAMLGVKSGYFVWRPYFADMEGSGVEEIEEGTGFLYGPVLSLGFTNALSFSFVALFGTQSTYWKNHNKEKEWGNSTITSTGTFYSEMDRADVDAALNYALLEYLKIFVGYKYQYTNTKMNATFISIGQSDVWHGNWEWSDPAHGPALGIGLSTTMGSNFFGSVNLSMLYMRSVYQYDKIDIEFYSDTAFDMQLTGRAEYKDLSFKAHQYGFNVEPLVGLTVEPIVVTLGARFQWMRHKFLEDVVIPTTPPQIYSWGWSNDYLYGIFVSVLYML